MDHGLELVIPRLEILEIEVCNIIYRPGNIGNRFFSIYWYPGNIGNWIFLFSHILEILEIEVCNILHNLEIRAAGGRRRAGGGGQAGGSRGCVVLPWIIFGTCFLEFPDIPEILEICCFLYFGIFPKKTRAEISRRMHRSMGRDLSYETDSGQKLKLFQTPISR